MGKEREERGPLSTDSNQEGRSKHTDTASFAPGLRLSMYLLQVKGEREEGRGERKGKEGRGKEGGERPTASLGFWKQSFLKVLLRKACSDHLTT